MIEDFKEEFAGLSDYARMYRELGLQAVPAHYPSKTMQNWKRPALKEWRDYQNNLADDDTFNNWFSHVHEDRNNIGILTGACSGRVFVIDLDTYAKPEADLWWSCCKDMQEQAGQLESPTQRTGRGGSQILFRAPEGWTAPTIKTSIGVDIRGVGGFIVAAPSMHESGVRYQWVEDFEPWNIPIATAPRFLCDQIDLLAEQHGGHTPSDPHIKTSTPSKSINEWGRIVDGREDLMTRMVFKAVIELYRDCPIIPSKNEQIAAMAICFESYLSAVTSRLSDFGASKEDLLEKEGRGRTLFDLKWKAAIRQWDKKISQEAAHIPVKEEIKKPDPFAEPPPKRQEEPQAEPQTEEAPPEDEFEPKKKKLLKLYTLDEVDHFVPPKAIVQDVIAENTLGFIYGPPGCGKTFVALSMGLSVAYGFKDWLWGKKIEKTGPVIYISLEGRGDIKNRTLAWRKHHNVQSNNFFRLILDPVNFMNEDSVREFVQALDDFITDNPNPALIFIDTVSRAIAGGDENDQKDMSKFVEICDKIKTRYLTSVIGVHHSGRSGTNMRGSTVLDGGADFMLRIERDKDNENMEGKIHAEKIKAYPDGWSKPFTLTKIELDAFGAVTSLVATSEPEKPSSAPLKQPEDRFGGSQETSTEPDMDMCRKMVEAIDEAWRGGYPWSKQAGKNSDRAAADKLADSFGLSIDVCQKYVNMWHRTDVIVTDIWGQKGEKRGLRRGKGL